MTADHAAIRARLDAATQGPWTWTAHTTADRDEWAVFNEDNWALATNRDGWVCDAELIAHAPTDLGALLDENERLTAKIGRVEALLADAPTLPVHTGGGNLVNHIRAVRADALRAALDGSGS